MTLNVMHVTYDMRIGGTEMVIKNIIEGFPKDSGVKFSIFCLEQPLGPWGVELSEAGIPITTVQRKDGFDTSLVKAIRQHIKQFNIDIVQCHQYTPWVYGLLGALGTKAKVIFTEHGRFYPDRSSWKRKLLNPWFARLTSAITTISKATKSALVEYEAIPEQRIEVIYNGIAPLKPEAESLDALREKLGLAVDDIVFGTVARFDPIKNQTMMIKAFAKVAANTPNARLLLVGDGEEKATLSALVEQLDLVEQVIFTGYISNPTQYIALMDIFLLSSLSEGTSMTLLEAMSIAKPCVVTDAGGNAEIILNKHNGLVAPNNDEAQFSAAMNTLATDKNLQQEYGKNASTRFTQHFSVGIMNGHYAQLYKRLSQ